MPATAAISQRVKAAPTTSMGARYRKPSGISAAAWASMAAINAIIRPAMGSDVRRVPDKNMERNDIFSLFGVPLFILMALCVLMLGRLRGLLCSLGQDCS